MGKVAKTKRSAQFRPRKENPLVQPAEPPLNWQRDFLWLLPALVLGFLVYINALGGEFVYDDQIQISRNPLIQDPSQFWHALTSDVWSFQGSDQTTNNYWRPSFVLWLILNFKCFGFYVTGWHLTNVLLHVGVIVLVFMLTRQFGLAAPVAAAIALIFAVHPVHCESVAWISGVPDLILAVALLGSLYFVDLLRTSQTSLRWIAALGLYVVALGAKETALLFPLIVITVLFPDRTGQRGKSIPWGRIMAITWPFVALTVAYFLIRQLLLGAIQRIPEGNASFQDAVLTAPAVVAFYLHQIIFPYWIGPTYSLRAVTLQNIGFGNFILPLVVTISVLIWFVRRAMVSKTARIGLALLMVPLLPAMNIVAFHPEQLVHDRYLYLPLFGFLLLTIPWLASLGQQWADEKVRARQAIVYAIAIVVSVPLTAQAISYNQAWTSNIGLWARGIKSDPTSATNYQRYGTALYEAKRLDEAIAAFNHSIELAPVATTYIVRATAWIDQNKFAEAEHDLRAVVAQTKGIGTYTLYRAYRDLGVCLSNQGKTDQAADAVKEGRTRLPQYAAALTTKLSSILWKAGRKEEAITELNGARRQAHTESLPESRLLLYLLGLAYTEVGQPGEARQAFVEFLSVTRGMLTPGVKEAIAEAQTRLQSLEATGSR
jgi:tetratricopeptide (TPR) repeat protein